MYNRNNGERNNLTNSEKLLWNFQDTNYCVFSHCTVEYVYTNYLFE